MTNTAIVSAGTGPGGDAPLPAGNGRWQDRRRVRWAVIVAAAVLLAAVMLGAILVGPAGLSARGVVLSLVDSLPGIDVDTGLTAQQHAILWQIRMPRVVLGALVGATLAIAGAAYQGVFRNPLADPYLLGVSSGAGLGATAAIVAGLSMSSAAVPTAAFIGGAAAVTATLLLGRTVGGGRSETVIILAGVAVAAFANAGQTYLMQQHSETLRQVYSWLLGRLATDGWNQIQVVVPYVVVTIAVVLAFRRTLDVMLVGDTEAASLGVEPVRVRLLLIAVATLGTAAVVSVSGLIGFVGIVVPHAVRMLVGPGHRLLLPLSVLVGAVFLVCADLLARTIIAPAELSIGVVTAAIGAPFFLLVLRRGRVGR